MNAETFDALSRRFGRKASRRHVLKAGAAGAAVTAISPFVSTGPIDSKIAMAQADQRRTVGAPDIAKLAFDLEYDLGKIFDFVATQIAYEPYSGVLRGPIGTLWGKSGNSMDQALLLKALLDESKISNRIAQGALSQDVADRLLASTDLDPESWKSVYEDAAGPNSLSTTDSVVDSTPIPAIADDLRTRAGALNQEFFDTILQQTLEQSQLIVDQLSRAGATLSQPALQLPSLEASNHTWIQVANGTEWQDLDPSVPDAAASQRFADDFTVIDAIPDESHHRVTFRLLGDVVSGDTTQQNEWLNQTVPSSDLVGAAINLFHVKPNSIGVSIDAAIAGKDPYVAVLQIGETNFESPLFGFTGQEGALTALGDSGITDGEPVAEWLEMTVTSPDLEDIVEKRALFDRIGSLARESGTESDAVRQLKPIEPYPMQDETTGPFYLPLAGVLNLAVVSASVPGVYYHQEWSRHDTAGDLSMQNHSYHYVRDRVAQRLSKDLGVRTIRNRPTITGLGISIGTDDKKQLNSTISLDLIQPTTMTLPLNGVEVPFHPNVLEGTMNQIVEHNFFDFGSRLSDEAIPKGFISVSRLMRSAITGNVPLVTATELTDDTKTMLLDTSPSTLSQLSNWFDQGYVVILPKQAVDLDGVSAYGYWAVDPATGRTIDRMANGGGNALPEDATLLDVVLHYVHEFYVLASCVAGAALAVAGLLSLAIDGYSDAGLAATTAGAVHGAGFCLGAASGAGLI
jgi:hypothetical protein